MAPTDTGGQPLGVLRSGRGSSRRASRGAPSDQPVPRQPPVGTSRPPDHQPRPSSDHSHRERDRPRLTARGRLPIRANDRSAARPTLAALTCRPASDWRRKRTLAVDVPRPAAITTAGRILRLRAYPKLRAETRRDSKPGNALKGSYPRSLCRLRASRAPRSRLCIAGQARTAAAKLAQVMPMQMLETPPAPATGSGLSLSRELDTLHAAPLALPSIMLQQSRPGCCARAAGEAPRRCHQSSAP